MNRISKTFNKLKKSDKKAFIAYITAGYPSLLATKKLVFELEKAGVDIIELGVPFSDPMADGLTIQKSSEKALAGGTTLKKILKCVIDIRKKSNIPLVVMSYLNPIYHYGIKKFINDALKSGLDGAIIPDLPPDEASQIDKHLKGTGFDIIYLASPTSTTERLQLIARRSKGFIYYVSLAGVTGVRKKMPTHLSDNIRKIKRATDKPVCVGFGVSSEKQAHAICGIADGVIVGSAIVNVISKNLRKGKLEKKVGQFVARLADAVHQ